MGLKSKAVLAFAFATSVNAVPSLNFRRASPAALPSGWTSFGCYSDIPSARTLRTAAFTDVTGMTIESCLAFCTPAGYNFAGVEFSRECYCDNIVESPGVPIDASNCNMACTGDSSEICGGSNAITIFQHAQSATTTATSASTTSTPPPAPTPTIVKNVGTFEYKGCFVDRPDNQPRVIGTQLTIAGVSAETCTAACKAAGFPLAGLEFGQECWCAQYMSMVAPAPDSDCNMVCNADSTELCGAGNRLAVYQDTTATPIPTTQCLTTAILFPGAGGVPDFNFNLQMVPSSGGGTPTLLGAVFRNMTRPINQKIYEISAGPSLEVVTHAFVLSGNDIGDFSAGFGDAIVPGGPLLLDFVDSNSVNVCAQPNPLAPLGPFIGPPVLAVNGNSGVWSTCASDPLTPIFSATSANGQCSGVFLEMVPPAVA